MSDNLLPSAPPVPQEYFRVLTAGLKAFGDVQALRGLLSDRLDFTGSIAGHVPDAKEGFLQGVIGLIGTVRGIDIIRDVHDDAGSAVLYDAEMPGGTVRFAEFFTFGDGVINTLNVHYDGADYTAKGGR
jgi:hypothetical protein